MGDDRYSLLLTEALRQLDAQSRDLDQLRARASWLVSATAVSTSFLGGRVKQIEGFGWVAIGLFAATIALALWAIVGTVRRAPTGFSPSLVEREWIRERGLALDEVRLNLALQIERAAGANESSLGLRRGALIAASITMALEIGAWLLQLT